jgi:hypothetical protein
MPSPRKGQGSANGSDRPDLENVLRSAAKLFRTNPPNLLRQLSRKKSATVLYEAEHRCSQ